MSNTNTKTDAKGKLTHVRCPNCKKMTPVKQMGDFECFTCYRRINFKVGG